MTPEEVIAVSNECPICGAKDRERCREGGRTVGVAQLHVGRLRKQWGDQNPAGRRIPNRWSLR